MKSFIDQSQPPEPDDQKPVNLVRDQLAALREANPREWSNARIARRLGVSDTTVSQYMAGKYPGNVAGLEVKIEDLIRNETMRRSSGVETISCSETEQLRDALEFIRTTNDAGEILAHSGHGKSRAAEIYLEKHPNAILYHVRSWARDLGSIEGALFEAVGKNGYDNRTKRAVFMINKLRGSERLIIVDDAHKLTSPALQFLFDFHDETGCPIAFLGTFELEEKLSEDEQQYSRVGLRFEIIPDNPRELINHLIRQLAPSANGEADALTKLCQQVAKHQGHYRSVHKQLKLAAKIRDKQQTTWCRAFECAHEMLIRDFKLTV